MTSVAPRHSLFSRLLRRFLFALVSFLVLWMAVILALGFSYISRLLHPTCPEGLAAPSGYQAVSLTTVSGYTLRGWWRPPDNGAVVVLLGGLGANRDSMLPVADLLTHQGFGVVTADYRHCSGGLATLGYRETEELDAMVGFALAQPEVNHVAALGFSVGGAAVLRGAAANPQIEAVIAEGNYANLAEEMTTAPAGPLSLRWQLQQSALLAYWLLAGTSPASVSPLEAIPRIAPRPILFIHGENEAQRTGAQAQYAAARNAILWVVPGAGHGSTLQADPEEYQRRVVQFLTQSLLP